MPEGMSHKHFKANAILLSLLVLGYAAKYIFYAFLARHFSPKSYGDINIVFKMVNLVVPIVMLGLNNSMLRILPTMIANKEHGRISVFLHLVFRVIAIASLIAFALGGFFSLGVHLTGRPSLIGMHYPGILACFFVPFLALAVIFNSLLKCYKKYYFAVFSFNTLTFVIGLVLLGSAFYIFEVVNFYSAFLMILASYFLLVVIQLRFLYKPITQEFAAVRAGINPDPKWIPLSLYFMLSTLVYSALISIDLILLEILGPRAAETGYFSALITVAWIMFLVSQASTVIFNPKISEYHDAGRPDKLQRLLSTAFIFNILLGIVFCAVIISLGHTLLGHFGQEYVAHYPLLVVLTIGAFFVNILQTPSSMLVYTDYCKKAVGINIVSLVLAIVLDVILIPTYGMHGAAISLIGVALLSNLVKVIMVKHFLKLKPFIII